MSDQPTEAKTHPASPQKLKKQRAEGQVASSAQSSALVSGTVAIGFLAATAAFTWAGLASLITGVFDLIADPFDEARDAAAATVLWTSLWTVGPVVGLAIVAAFLTSALYNKGVLFSLKPVAPQLNRLSVSAGLKRIYGRRGVLESATALARVVLWLGFAILVGVLPFRELLYQWSCGTECMIAETREIFILLAAGAVFFLLLAAGFDMLIQNIIYLEEQKMTETERRRERREHHGSPEVRKELKRLRRTSDLPPRKTGARHANMCFYSDQGAVGVEFRPPEMRRPYLVAKAASAAEATPLRTTIANAGWPEMEHPELTRSLLAAPMGESLSDEVIPAFAESLVILFGAKR